MDSPEHDLLVRTHSVSRAAAGEVITFFHVFVESDLLFEFIYPNTFSLKASLVFRNLISQNRRQGRRTY